MASTINADNGIVSGSAGLKHFSDASGNLELQTNGVTAIKVDNNQHVTISGEITANINGNILGGDAHSILVQTAANVTGFIDAPNVANVSLVWDGNAFIWGAASGGNSATANTANTALHSNVADVANSVQWANVANAPAFITASANITGTAANATHANIADTANSIEWSNVANTPTFANVAFSGLYNELGGRPTALSEFTNDANFITTVTFAPHATVANVANSVVYANITGAPTNVSAFTNDANYLTTITGNLVKSALGYTPYNATNPDGFITSSGNVANATHANIADFTNGVDGANVIGDVSGSNHANIADSANSVSWSNVSSRPTKVSQFTNDSGFITAGANITGTASHATVADSANAVAYANVTGTPINLSSFNNDTNFITASANITGTAAHANIADEANSVAYANVTGTPNNLSDFLNDTNFITASANITGTAAHANIADEANAVSWANVTSKPINVSTWNNDAGYLTTITGSQVTTALGFNPIDDATLNQPNGVATLDSTGLIPSSLLPSFVDNVIEVPNYASLPNPGEGGKMYITIDNSYVYRWGGTVYVEIVGSPGSTDSITEGSLNLYYSNTRARHAISVGGDLTYSNSTGVITYNTPTTVSTFTNDAGYITESANITGTAAHANIADEANAVSWSNITSKPTNISTWTNDAGYITASADITGTAAKATVANVANAVAWSNVTSKPTNISTWTNDAGYITASADITGTADHALVADAANNVAWGNVVSRPTDVSFFTNDAGYITASADITGSAATVTQAAQANITSVGTLTSLIVSGNIQSNNAIKILDTSSNNQFTIDAGAGAGLALQMGNTTTANAYLELSVASGINAIDNKLRDLKIFNNNDTNLIVLKATSANIGFGTSSPAQKVDVNGNVKANVFIGSGAGLTNIPAGNISGNVAIANLSNFATTANAVAWANVVGKPTALSSFTNDSAFITASANITGKAAGLSGGAANAIVYQTSANNTSFIATPGTANTSLLWNGSGFVWATASPVATNIAGGAAKQIMYQSAANTTAFITAPTTASTYLQYNGTTFVWAAASGGSSTVTDDTATNATYYPVVATTSTGAMTAKVSSTKYTFNPSTGTLSATIFNSLSDINSKKNITDLDNVEAVLNLLRGVEFDFIDSDMHSSGYIAQELQKLIPHAVTEIDGKLTVNYAAVMPYISEGWKRHDSRLAALEEAVAKLSK